MPKQNSTVLLLGTMDTKGSEYAYVRDRLHADGVATILIDVGILGSPTLEVDVTRAEVAAAAQTDIDALATAGDRGDAVASMAAGAREIVQQLYRDGRFSAALALGGTGGTSLAAHAFTPLPIGVPKAIVSTAASGDTRSYIAESDLVLFPSVVDIAGVNRISSRILGNAAAAIAGMARQKQSIDVSTDPVVAASMFGVTTECVLAAQSTLEADGFEPIVFHMTGVGGRSLERLVRDGQVAGVLDVTTTELADELVGGMFSAGSGRLTGAAAAGIPQVVSVGALDMVNFGPRDSVPEKFSRRNLLEHNASITLMRTTADECAELGKRLAERVSQSTAAATIVLPLRGVSAVSIEGGPFCDPEADNALFDAIRAHVDPARVDIVELDADINDPIVADTMTTILTDHIRDAD